MTSNPEYKVGYKRPPMETQFKKGRAVNCRRSRKPKLGLNFPAIIDRMLERRVRVPMGDDLQTMTMLELITRQMVMKAGSGHMGAAKVLKRLNNLKRERSQKKGREYIFKVVPSTRAQE